MTAFQLKTKPEIQNAMFATVRTQLGDENIDLIIGAVLRAICEAASLSDAQQYVMIAKLTQLFDRLKCKGVDLDRRALDFGAAIFTQMLRVPAQTSISNVIVGDGTLRNTGLLAADVHATATTFSIVDATGWPVSGSADVERGTLREETIIFSRSGTTITILSPVTGFVNPHIANGIIETIATRSVLAAGIGIGASVAALALGTETAWPSAGTVIFERDTIRREALTFTRVGVTLTLGSTTAFAHGITTDVLVSTFGSDRPITAGTVAYVPADLTSTQILFRTKAGGTLLDGDFVTALIPVESDAAGAQTRVGSGTISQWQNSPFANATVTNPNAAVRGTDVEDDDSYNARISAFIQSLSRATALAIETLTAGQQDAFSNLVIAFAQTVEPVGPGQAQLYITDGSPTFAIDYQIFTGRDVLIPDARPNDARARLHAYGPFMQASAPAGSITPRIYKSVQRGTSTLTGVNFLEDSTQAFTVNAYAGMYLKASDNQFHLIASNTAIRFVTSDGATPASGSYAVMNFGVTPLVPGTDFNFNPSNGDLELVVPLVQHDALVAASDGASGSVGGYTYSRGLAAFAQRLVNGDRTDLNDFPGIKALGTQCLVIAPTVITPSIVIQILTQTGFADTDLISTVQSVVQSYVNGLGIGQEVLLSQIIKLVKSIAGVADCKIISPTANVVVSAGQIPRMNASDVQVV